MAITTLDRYIGATKNNLVFTKTNTTATIAYQPFSLFDLLGNPGVGTLNVGNTANGLVPTDAIAGYPAIPTFGATGYISKIDFFSTVACRLQLYDRVFVAGAYSFDANVTLASQPSYSGRIPNAFYGGLELWVEVVTAFTGSPSFQINYLDQDGNAGDTGVVASGAALTLKRCFPIPLAAGDSGIQQITQVRCTVSTVGTFNVMVLRPLWSGRVNYVNSGDVHDLLRTGLIKIYDTSALYTIVVADSTSSGAPYMIIEVADG